MKKYVILATVCWFAFISLVGIILTVYDKRIAGSGKRRIPEATLMTVGLLGAAVGGQLFFGKRRFLHQFIRLIFCFRLFRLRHRLRRLRVGARQQFLLRLFGLFQLLRQIRAFLRERVHLPGKRVVVRLCLLQTLLQTCQFDLKARIFSGKLIALVGQLAQGLLVLNGCRFDIIDNVGAVKAADRRAEL